MDLSVETIMLINAVTTAAVILIFVVSMVQITKTLDVINKKMTQVNEYLENITKKNK